jgi:predicted O-methyltransferase YrrM
MSMANSKSKITTVEGCIETAKIAKENFNLIKAKNITLMEGNFDDVLPQFLKEERDLLDFVFVDGNHTYDATMRYFQLCKEKVSPNAIMVFDDIYWSEGMNKAWEEIKANPSVQCSVDIFEMGFIFFDKKLEKADYVIKY